jgi:hypothetical protein
MRTQLARWIAVAAWAGAVGLGMRMLWVYSATPGIAAEPPASWPDASTIQRKPGVPTLVMVAHPECPCTRASVGELAGLMAEVGGGVDAHVLFHAPSSAADDWRSNDLWRLTAAVPGVEVHRDDGGRDAGRFHSVTSGQVLLYDPAGHLLYAGGITGGRGQAGGNAGRARVVSLVTRGVSDKASAPVFGCALAAAEAATTGGTDR